MEPLSNEQPAQDTLLTEDNPVAPNRPSRNAFVARQPIFDRNQNVSGYELLFRSSSGSQSYDGTDGTKATFEVIANTMFGAGLENIAAGKAAFVNFTRELLLGDYASVLPSESTVVEILESVRPDADVIEACRHLKTKGILIALDDFSAKDLSNPLTRYADIIKVDFQATSPEEQQLLAARFRHSGVKMLAEKVETGQQFRTARGEGYALFQGYFFAHPEIVSGKQVPAFKKHYYDLLCVIHRPNFEYGDIEAIIKQELSLVYKLLRYINSARFGWSSRVNSIRHALVLLGAQEIRTWASLAIMSSLGEDKPSELVKTGTIRARFCELLGQRGGLDSRREDLLLMGMFSVMDALMQAPLEEALVGLRLEPDILAALLGIDSEDNRMAQIYRLVRAFEVAEWDTVACHASQLGLREESVPPSYFEAVQWAEHLFATTA